MSENWGANIDTRAAPALPQQPAGPATTEPATDRPATDQPGAQPSPRDSSGEADGQGEGDDEGDGEADGPAPAAPLASDNSTNPTEEGPNPPDMAARTPLLAPSSISAPVWPPNGPPAALTVGTVGRAWRALVDAVSDLLDGRDGIWALEAGAGTRTLFDLPEDAFIVGVDRDPRALESNVRLDQRISVELDEYRPLSAGFDLITSWYVLDNLDDPAPVLDRFAEWTGDDGLLVLAVPNLRSPRGIVARLTGKARLRRSLTPRAMRRRFGEHGFTPAFHVFFEDGDQIELRRRFKLTHGWWKATQALVRVVSFGALDAARTDYIVVFRRDRPTPRPGDELGC